MDMTDSHTPVNSGQKGGSSGSEFRESNFSNGAETTA